LATEKSLSVSGAGHSVGAFVRTREATSEVRYIRGFRGVTTAPTNRDGGPQGQP